MIALFFCCTTKKNSNHPSSAESEHPDISTIDSSLFISLVCDLQFNRSFSSAQFMNDEKEIEQYYKRQEKSNPVWIGSYSNYDTLVKKRFETLGIVKGDELLLHKFRFMTRNHYQFPDHTGKKINIHFKRDTSGTSDTIKIFSEAGSGKAGIRIRIPFELKYNLMDIIPGGNKEIVLLNESYISNNYLFDLEVYEIKRKQIGMARLASL